MGGLRKYMPITYWTCLVGSLALIGFPGTVGLLLQGLLDRCGAHVASRRAPATRISACWRRVHHRPLHLPDVLHDLPRRAAHGSSHAGASARESLGGDGAADAAGHSLGGDRLVHGRAVLFGGYFGGCHSCAPGQRCAGARGRGVSRLAGRVHGVGVHRACRFGSRLLGVFTAWLFFLKKPALADAAERSFKWLHTILINKYGFDWFNEHVIVAAARSCWAAACGDSAIRCVIDGGLVNGSARTVGWLGSVMRYAQSGYLYHYAFAMILGTGLVSAVASYGEHDVGGHCCRC